MYKVLINGVIGHVSGYPTNQALTIRLGSIINRETGMKYAKAMLGSIVVLVLLDFLMSMLIPDRAMNVMFFVVAAFVLLGMPLVVIGTVTKNRWGINVESVNCPACGSTMPQVRQPKSLRERLWGGWTCAKCGCEMDKWGRLITRTR